MTSTQGFRPNWVSSPGETIIDILRERGLSEAEFAKRLGRAEGNVKDLLEGRATITIAIAQKLERILGASMEFWMLRDLQYRQNSARLHQVNDEWSSQLPIGDMIKFGWLAPAPSPSDEMDACLRFFGVSNVRAWHKKYAHLERLTAFRTSPSFESRPAAVATWLRQGEIEAESINCKPWNAKRFRKSLLYIRSLTREKDPSKFIPELTKRCANSGVAVAIVRAPNGCRASGATRFLSPEKALLQLSFRYLTDDHFWFTFFHEAGHLLLHGEKGFFLEGAGMPTTTEEDEANDFAARVLVPDKYQVELSHLRTDTRNVIRFARRIGVSPGIIVGQLQHLKRLRYNQLNSLKRRFKWIS